MSCSVILVHTVIKSCYLHNRSALKRYLLTIELQFDCTQKNVGNCSSYCPSWLVRCCCGVCPHGHVQKVVDYLKSQGVENIKVSTVGDKIKVVMPAKITLSLPNSALF